MPLTLTDMWLLRRASSKHDEMVARIKDLLLKLEGGIPEFVFPGVALPALIDVAVSQLLECTDPEEAFRHFVGDLLAQFEKALDEPDENS
jgi:hypothetical protein